MLLFPAAACRLLPALLLAATVAAAQQTPAASPVRSAVNVVRLDLGGPLVLTLGYNAFRNHTQLVAPVLLGYEHQLGGRTSASVEVLLNGGTPDNMRSGVGVQGRYYFAQPQRGVPLGLYAAPTLSYRAIRRDERYDPAGLDHQLGGGVLVGAQLPLGAPKRVVVDLSLGAMSWQLLNGNAVAERHHTYYQQSPFLLDGRLSLGYRF